MQQEIYYSELEELGFKFQPSLCSVTYKQKGQYPILGTKKLWKTISVEWDNEDCLCRMIRIDNNRDCNIIGSMPINNIQELKSILKFYGKLNEPRP